MVNFLYNLIIYPITEIIELVFTFSEKVFKEPAVSILAISVVINLLCLPLYDVAEKWQALERDTVKKLKPKVDRIRTAFSGDERFMIQQVLYRQNHYHPVYALRSTFGLLIQIPFFIAAFVYLSNLEVLKGTPFLFISNLGAPDKLFEGINVLPLVMTAINVFSSALYSRGFLLKDKIPLYFFAVIFLVLLYNSPSGLVIYWTMNNLFSLIKNIFYRIPFKNKGKIVAFIFSVFSVLVSFYLLFLYHGAPSLRNLISIFFIFLGILPWVFFAVKKFLNTKNIQLHSPLKPDFFLFIFSFTALWSLCGVFLPSMLIAASPQEFSFVDNYTTPLFFIVNTCFQAAGFFIVWPLFLYFLFGKRIKSLLSLLGSLFLLGALVNIFIFTGNYGLISVELVFNSSVNHNIHDSLVNLAVLFIPIVIIFTLYLIKKEKLLITVSLLCLVSVLGYSSYNIYKINNEFQKVKEFHAASNDDKGIIKPVFHLSQTGKNTVVIMLDRAVSVFIPYIFDEDPDLKNIFSGFTYYPNTVSFNGYTSLGAPPLFGGYEYSPIEVNKRNTVPLVTKHDEALLLMPKLFSDAGYSVTVTDPPYPNYSSKDDLRMYSDYPNVNAFITDSRYTNTWIKEHNMAFPSTSDILKRNLLWYSLFRISPLALRQGIYLQGDWCSPSLMQKMTLTLNGYAVLDYMKNLTDFKSEKENTALLMVNNTTHEPSFLQAPDYRPVPVVTNYGQSPFSKETAYHVNAAAMKRLGEWFNFLKSSGAYDNTRIILVSDHGPEPNFLIKTSLPFNIEQFNPLLMVKDFNSSEPMKTDMTFMSNADVPSLAMKGLIEDPVNPFTGKKITTDLKSGPLYIAISGSIHLEDPNTTMFTLNPKIDYYVHDNIFQIENWERVEK